MVKKKSLFLDDTRKNTRWKLIICEFTMVMLSVLVDVISDTPILVMVQVNYFAFMKENEL